MLEAKDQGHKRKCSPKKKKKFFTKIFQAISTKKRLPKNFSGTPRILTIQKIMLCPRAEDRPIFEDLRPQGQGLQNASSRPRTSSRTPSPLESRDVEAEAVEAVNFLWKRKHFDGRGWKRN